MLSANQNGEIFSCILLQQKTKIQQHRVRGCLPLCQTHWSEISETTQGKWNDIFRLKRANQ